MLILKYLWDFQVEMSNRQLNVILKFRECLVLSYKCGSLQCTDGNWSHRWVRAPRRSEDTGKKRTESWEIPTFSIGQRKRKPTGRMREGVAKMGSLGATDGGELRLWVGRNLECELRPLEALLPYSGHKSLDRVFDLGLKEAAWYNRGS